MQRRNDGAADNGARSAGGADIGERRRDALSVWYFARPVFGRLDVWSPLLTARGRGAVRAI